MSSQPAGLDRTRSTPEELGFDPEALRRKYREAYLVTGAISLTAGFAGLGFINASTPLVFIAVAMLFIGTGVGMTLQNFVLVVQNSVSLRDIGAASATVSFFRSLGGTIGVAVLGAVLARQVAGDAVHGIPAPVAYGDATGTIFAISAGVALLGVLAAILLKPIPLRTSLDTVDPTGPTTP